jgi:hypothetical protein
MKIGGWWDTNPPTIVADGLAVTLIEEGGPASIAKQ